MARRVRHYSNCGNYYDYYREHNKTPKTACGRDMTALYSYTNTITNVTCSRCLSKLNKEQMMAGQANGQVLRIDKVADIGSCGDEKVDLYLQRLGIC